MMNEILILQKTEDTINDSGTAVSAVVSEREVFCQIKSIGMKESYEALSKGHRPEIKAVLSDVYDYDGERQATYNGVAYNILRTYQHGISLELTLERM